MLSRFSNESNQILLGPYRVFPGRLSVSRTIGDIEAKKEQYGGLPNVIIATPEIFKYDISDADFILLGCDGIFDQLSNKEVNDCAWMVIKLKAKETVHSKCSFVIDMILKSAMKRKSLDNVTCLMIALKKFDDKTLANFDKATITSSLKQSPNYCLKESAVNNGQADSRSELSTKKASQDRLFPVNNSNTNYKDANMNLTSKIKPNIRKSNEPTTAFNRCEKNKSPMNTARYYVNNNDKMDGKLCTTLPNSSISGSEGVNQFLTPTNVKLNKDVSNLKKKKDFLFNEQKYNTIHTETYTTSYPYAMSKAFHMNNSSQSQSQRYDIKYRPKYSNY